MNSFSYLVPTKVIFGTDALDHLPTELKASAAKKVLVIYGSGSVIKSGVLAKVTKALDEAGVAYVTKGGVKANPTLEFAYEACEFGIKEQADFVLAVGGGSVIDTAKAVAHGISNPDIDIWDLYLGKQTITKSLPIATILTISAAGSETSSDTVLTNTKTLIKRGFATELNRPVFSLLNPEFTYTLPKYQVACGSVDIMMHSLDRYFAADTDNELTDQISEGLMRTVMLFANKAVENSHDYKAMSEIMWCGSISHNGLTGLGNTKDFAPHQLSHGISAVYDAAHGAALAVCWGGFANYVYERNVARFARYARNVIGLVGDDDAKIAKEGIDKTLAFFKSLGMPGTLTELIGHEPTAEEIEKLSILCSFDKSRKIGSMAKLDYDDMVKIYESIK